MDTRGKWRTSDGKWVPIADMEPIHAWFAARYLFETRVALAIVDSKYVPTIKTKGGELSPDTIEKAIAMDRHLRRAGWVSPLSMEFRERLPIPSMESIQPGHVIALDPSVTEPASGAMLEAGRDGLLWVYVESIEGASDRSVTVAGKANGRSHSWTLNHSRAWPEPSYGPSAVPVGKAKSTISAAKENELLGLQRALVRPVVRPDSVPLPKLPTISPDSVHEVPIGPTSVEQLRQRFLKR